MTPQTPVDLSHVCKPLQYAICVSGAAAGRTVISGADEAERLGARIAERGHILTTGATIGLPYHAAKGAKSKGGMSIGFSPASSLREHVRKYRLPHCYFDFINYTGMNYVGRDQYLVQSSDAVITIGGRFGTLHEFTSALESGVPCGVLIGSDGAADVIPKLMEVLEPPHRNMVIYDTDPEKLVDRIIQMLDLEYHDIKADVDRGQEHWFMDRTNRRG